MFIGTGDIFIVFEMERLFEFYVNWRQYLICNSCALQISFHMVDSINVLFGISVMFVLISC